MKNKMQGQVISLLDRQEVTEIQRKLSVCAFVDGRATAGGKAALVKDNLQVETRGDERSEIDQLVTAAIQRNQDLQNFAIPTRFTIPIYSRYEPGMKYGDHVDNALMGGMNGVRTDLAMTVFLSPPSSYDGGELVIPGVGEIKLDVGEAYLYPATSIHRVAPVTRGARLAIVTWFQSAVRDEFLRGIICDMAGAIQKAEALGNSELELLLIKTYHNLIRYAAEPR
jgi:PKHD-type hydroxylase